MAEHKSRYAVVSGGNKGIGYGICEELASRGIMVILTARDEKRGLEALHKLKHSALSDYLLFHQLDVSDSESIASLAHFITTRFGKLDILVNNAGVSGVEINADAVTSSDPSKINWSEAMSQTHELAEQCVTINYYGAKRMIEALTPLLKLSDSPRIVNVSSSMGQLENVSNGWAKEILSNDNTLSEEIIDEVLTRFLKDFEECSCPPESKGWPAVMSAYKVSKAALNGYTRIQAKTFPNFRINCVCPGYVKTDINLNTGRLSVKEVVGYVVMLALLPNDGPSGLFFFQKEVAPF
ncbi:NAD(P)-binding Rossmann-fold superfamily protein [Euphorbia peplus]|nr:NAD(P)-binding Rossmann-fold superfamily protein [Euphorbia peplus]